MGLVGAWRGQRKMRGYRGLLAVLLFLESEC
jgi:hypothetical protein